MSKPIVLSLNRNWERIGWMTPKQAFVALCGGAYGGTPPALAISITLDENGKLVEAIPLKWEEWIKLPVRECDFAIGTKNGPVRCPTVVIRPGFSKMPLKAPRLCSKAIFERDGGKCQYTGEFVPKGQGNLDHVVPKDRGGKDTFENLVWCKKELNSKKGNRLNEEAGLKLIRKPVAPKPVPACFAIREPRMPEHVPFIIK